MIAPFALGSLSAWGAVTAFARFTRGPLYARFAAVILGIYTLLSLGLVMGVGSIAWPLRWVLLALHAAVYLHFVTLMRPRMRPFLWRMTVSLPAQFFVASTVLAMPWAVLLALGFHPAGLWVPYALGALGLVQSLTTKREERDLMLDGVMTKEQAPIQDGAARVERPLRLVQITDPHLGPFMSVARLKSICARAVKENPDLVLLTGDFLTMESQSDASMLTEALEPLKALSGKTFACFGNHDHEAPEVVRSALASNGVTLLVDDSACVQTPAGPVQIVGFDFAWNNRPSHMADVVRRHPRVKDHLRLVLLHDPGAFKHLPEGEGDLVLSGHTHGGQVGLVSLGRAWTFVRALAKGMPDHGFWARGRDRLYVHKGSGHYGFPLRLGVPAEEGLLRVHQIKA